MSKLTMDSAQQGQTRTVVSDFNDQLAEKLKREVPGLGSVISVRKEIDDTMADQREFYVSEPDRVMRAVSGHSARLVEIVVQIGRVEVARPEWKPVREEAERVLQELRQQFQIASRRQAGRELEWNMTSR
jgi:hypothetical protein